MGSLLVQQLFIRETLHIFITVFSSVQLEQKENKFRETTEISLEFLVSLDKQIKGKRKNKKNYLHGKAPNKQKKNKEIFLGFLLNITTKHA